IDRVLEQSSVREHELEVDRRGRVEPRALERQAGDRCDGSTGREHDRPSLVTQARRGLTSVNGGARASPRPAAVTIRLHTATERCSALIRRCRAIPSMARMNTAAAPTAEDRRASERVVETLRLLNERLAPKRRVVHAGEVLCTAGERFEMLYVLTSGSFKMVN